MDERDKRVYIMWTTIYYHNEFTGATNYILYCIAVMDVLRIWYCKPDENSGSSHIILCILLYLRIFAVCLHPSVIYLLCVAPTHV